MNLVKTINDMESGIALRDMELFLSASKKYCEVAIFGKLKYYKDAEDLVQNVLVRLYKNVNTYDPQKGSIKTFVNVMINYSIMDFYRKYYSKGNAANVSTIPIDSADPSEELDSDYCLSDCGGLELAEVLNDIILNLPELDKKIMCLRAQEYTFEEISSMLDMSFTQVRYRYNKIIKNYQNLH